MKKILIILLLVINIKSVYASETYYSDYSELSDYTTDLVEESDLVSVQEEKRYRWYHLNELESKYFIEGENNINYPNIDLNDYIVNSFTDWSFDKPKLLKNRVIEERNVYKYQDMKQVRYIHLTNVEGSYGALIIPEIEIIAKGFDINYSVTCEECSSEFNDTINDDNKNINTPFIRNGGSLHIDLRAYYDIDEIEINLYIYDEGTHEKRYNISFTPYPELTPNYVSYEYVGNFTASGIYQSNKITHRYDLGNLIIANPEYEEEKISLNYLEETPTRKVELVKQYRYQDKLYRYYNNLKDYSDEYSLNGTSYYNNCDYNDYILYYRYKTREKIVFQDNFTITKMSDSLENYIIESTVPDIKIKHNIDFSKNGIYPVKYILPFKTITKEVIVDIKENNINENIKIYPEKINIDSILDSLNSNISEQQNIKLMLEELNNKISNQKDIELNKYKEKIYELESIIIEQDNKLNESKNTFPLLKIDNKLGIPLVILFISCLLTMVTIFIIKICQNKSN